VHIGSGVFENMGN